MMQPSDLDYGNNPERTDRRRHWSRSPLVIGLLTLLLFAAGFGAFLVFADRSGMTDSEDVAADGGTSTTEGSDGTSTGEATDDGSGEGVAADDTSTENTSGGGATEDDGAPPMPDGAFVEATLDLEAAGGPGLFTLTGRVPDQETADAVLQAAELSYAPFVESNLEVDETLDPAPWLAAGPLVIGLLPTITDGTIRLVDGSVQLDARSPNPQYLAILEGAIDQITGGMPVEVVDAEITDLEPPLFSAAIDEGQVTLTGYVPSEPIRDLLAGGAAAAYGPENVTNDLTIDESTYTSFWMYTMPGIFQLFTFFPKYSLTVQDGFLSGTLQGGVNFAVDSTEITPEAAERLNVGVAILARDISLFMTVVGHTDSSGPDDYNEALSLARAESVTAYFAAAGIDPARLQPAGAGESDPIASNETDEGKALNRRVEFDFGPAPTG
jgi:outer membrane protein OmpA-like peptidoglycan-associated protein